MKKSLRPWFYPEAILGIITGVEGVRGDTLQSRMDRDNFQC